MSKLLRLAVVAALVLPSVGCSSTDDIQDAVSAINPFGDGKDKLPGERRPVLTDEMPTEAAKGRPVAITGTRTLSGWPNAAGPASNDTGNIALSGNGAARVWSTSAAVVGSGSMIRGDVRAFARPVADGARIFVLDPSGNVTAVSNGGGLAWRTSVRPADIDEPATSGGLATDGARVYAATAYGTVVALDAGSGAKVWEQPLPEPAGGAPTVADGRLYVVTQGAIVVALSASDGTEAWTYRGVPESGSVLASTNPAVSGGVVVVPFTSGELIALDAKTGGAVWNDALARAGRTFAVSGLTAIAASPVVADGVVYAAGIGSRTVAIGLKTGERLWDIPYGSLHTPVASGNALFMVDLDDNLMALDRRTGEVMWATKLPVTKTKKKRSHWAGPVLAGGLLRLVSSDGGIMTVDPASGAIGASQSGNPAAMTAPIVAGGRLVVLSGNGTLTAYE